MVTKTTVTKWATGAGITGVAIGFLVFIYLNATAAITILNYSNNTVCFGTIKNPCVAHVEFIANQNISIPALSSSNWFTTDKPLKKVYFYIDGVAETGKAFNLTQGKRYSLDLVALKNNPTDTVKWSFTKAVDPTFLPVNSDQIFTKLIDNNGGIVSGTSTWKLNNPVDNLSLKGNLNLSFNVVRGRVTKYEIYINQSQIEKQPIIETEIINKSCQNLNNETNQLEIQDCSYPNITVIGYKNVNKEVYLLANNIIISKGEYTIRSKVYFTVDSIVDWFPTINIPKANSGLTNDTRLTQTNWAWYNQSWGTAFVLSNISGSIHQEFIANRTDMNWTSGFSDIRVLDVTNTTELNYTFIPLNATGQAWNSTGFMIRIFNDGATNVVIFYNNTQVSTTSNATAVYGKDLVDYFAMEETSGTKLIGLNSYLNGTFSTVNPNRNTSCYLGGCISLNGASSWVNISRLGTTLSAQSTLIGAALTTGWNDTVQPKIVGLCNRTTSGIYWSLYKQSSPTSEIGSRLVGTTDTSQPINITNLTWYHMAAEYNSTNSHIMYLNGTFLSFTAGNWPGIPTNLIASIGQECDNSFARHFKGSVDEVAIFNRTLSATEISKIANQTINGGVYSADIQAPPNQGNITLHLVNPNNNTIFSTASSNLTYTFGANLTENTAGLVLVNATLYLWDDSNVLINKTTNSLNGTFNQTNVTTVLPYSGNWTYNFYGCDSYVNCTWSSENNYTFTVQPYFNVQSGQVTMTTYNKSIQLNPVMPYKSFVQVKQIPAALNLESYLISANITNTTELYINRNRSTSMTFSWEVVESSDFNIQKGTIFDTTNNLVTNFLINISEVNISNSFIINSEDAILIAGNSINSATIYSKFRNSTSIDFNSSGADNANRTIYWQVISWNKATTQFNDTLVNGTVLWNITQVNLTNSFIISNGLTKSAVSLADTTLMHYFVNSTQIAFYKEGSANYLSSWTVITHPSLYVQSGFFRLENNTRADVNINSVIVNNSFSEISHEYNITPGTSVTAVIAYANISSKNKLSLQDLNINKLINNSWFVIEYGHTSLSLIPPNVSIVYPTNTTYNLNVSQLNYTTSPSGVSCWYSRDSGVTNSTIKTCGTNFTNVLSIQGTNIWTLYANDSNNNLNSTNVTFAVDTIPPQWSLNSTNSTTAGTYISHNVFWNDSVVGLSSYIFSWCNATINSTVITPNITIYNFTDTTNNHAYNATPGSSTPMGAATEASAAQYLNMSRSNGSRAGSLSTATNAFPFWRFNFTIPPATANLTTLNISIRGLTTSNGETSNAYVLNSSGNLTLIGSIATTDTNLTINFTTLTDFNRLINPQKQLTVYVECVNCDSGEGPLIDYVQAQVASNVITGGVTACTDPGAVMQNDTPVKFTNNLNWSNISKFVPSAVGATIKWRVWANDTLDNWNSTSVFSYITTSGVANTCTYSGSGNWNINCGDFCNITTNNNLGDANLTINGTGFTNITGTITNFTKIKIFGNDATNRCVVRVSAGGKIID